jgi:hypothetical protein
MRLKPGIITRLTFNPDPKKRLRILLLYSGTGIFLNFFVMQVFCMPVWYAAIMCTCFFVSVTLFPFIKPRAVKYAGYFFLGWGVPICLYCIIFLADPFEKFHGYVFYTSSILFFGAGLVAYLPFYLLFHIYKYFRVADNPGKFILAAGVIIPFIALSVYLHKLKQYSKTVHEISAASHSQEKFFEKIPRNYFTERYLGLKWKYHTQLCYWFDGWRPPLNDPFLIIGLWLELYHVPGYKILDNRYWPQWPKESIPYHKKLFPDKPLKVNCPCSFSGSGMSYLDANLDSLK